MKRLLKDIPILVLLTGAAGVMLRLWLNSTRDAGGFVVRGHISGFLLLLFSLAVLGGLYWICRYFRGANKYSFNFPASPVSAAGMAVGALGIAVTAAQEIMAAPELLGLLTGALGVLAAAALALAAWKRWKGVPVSVFIHGGICIYLMLRLFSMYRNWSADPRLEEYLCELLALASGMVAVYHRAAFGLDMGNRRWYVFFNLVTAYFCCVSLVGGMPVFYVAMGVWMLTDLCDLTPMPREFWG